MSSRESHYGLKPWEGAPIQVAKGWLGGPRELSRYAAPTKRWESPCCNPSLRLGKPQGGKIGAPGDLKQGPTSRAAQVFGPLNLTTWGNSPPFIKSFMGERAEGPPRSATADHGAAHEQPLFAPEPRTLATITPRGPQFGCWGGGFSPERSIIWRRHSGATI